MGRRKMRLPHPVAPLPAAFVPGSAASGVIPGVPEWNLDELRAKLTSGQFTAKEIKDGTAEIIGVAVLATRTRRGMDRPALAKRMSCRPRDIHDIEDGKLYPTGNMRGRLLGTLHELEPFRALFMATDDALATLDMAMRTADLAAAADEPPPVSTPRRMTPPAPRPSPVLPPAALDEELDTPSPVDPLPVEPAPMPTAAAAAELPPVAPGAHAPPVPPLTSPARDLYTRDTPFHVALFLARTATGLSHAEVAELVGVTPRAVMAWEENENTPVEINLRKLLDLFPALRGVRLPESRDIPVPRGGPKTGPRSAPVSLPPPGALRGALALARDVATAAALLSADGGDAAAVVRVLRAAARDGLTAGEALEMLGIEVEA